MIITVFRKEWLQALRLGRVRWLLGIALLLAFASGLHTFSAYLNYQNEHALASQISRGDWLSQEAKNPHSAAHYGLFVFKPWLPGSLFDPGLLPFTGTTAFVEAHVKNDANHAPISDRTTLARWGSLSPAFILLYLVPLLMIAIHFDTVSGERASQMLKWTATTGLPFGKWLAGKWLAIIVLPAFFLILCLGGSWLAAGFTWDHPQLLFGLLLGFLLFYAVLANLILWVSAFTKTPASSLLVLLAVWILMGWAVPKVAANMAEIQHPAPSIAELRQRIDAAKRDGLMGDAISSERLAELSGQILNELGIEDTPDAAVNRDALNMQAGEAYGYEIFDHFYQEVESNHEQQRQLFLTSSALSPLLPAAMLSMAFSQTDAHAHWHFNRAVELYRREFVEILNREMMLHSQTGDWGYHSHPSTWSKIPEFHYQSQPPTQTWQRAKGYLFSLSLWGMLTSVLTFWIVPARWGWRG